MQSERKNWFYESLLFALFCAQRMPQNLQVIRSILSFYVYLIKFYRTHLPLQQYIPLNNSISIQYSISYNRVPAHLQDTGGIYKNTYKLMSLTCWRNRKSSLLRIPHFTSQITFCQLLLCWP